MRHSTVMFKTEFIALVLVTYLAHAHYQAHAQSDDKCALLRKHLDRLGCEDAEGGSETEARCQRKAYSLCKHNCTDSAPEDSACSAYSGFAYGCERLQARWERRNCTMEGGVPERRCSGLKAKLDAKDCTGDSETDSCADLSVTELDEAWRHPDVKLVDWSNCDQNLTGWYRFKMNASDATISTTCPMKKHCGAYYTMWLDLEGAELPADDQEKQVKACVSSRYPSSRGIDIGPCCWTSMNITARGCTGYTIFKLNGLPSRLISQAGDGCDTGFCVQ